MTRHFFFEEPILMLREIDVPETDDSLHRVLRLLATTVRHGTVDSSLTFDRRWNCPQCRPQLVRRQVERIAEAPWSEIWIQVAENTTPARRSAREKASRRAADFVAIPMGDYLAVLTSSQIDETAEQIPWHQIKEVLGDVIERKADGNISSSPDFLPLADNWKRYWEAYSTTTTARCWHTHERMSDAKACAAKYGLDSWRTRRFSGRYALGRLNVVSGQEVRQLLDQYDIATVRKHDQEGLDEYEAGEWDEENPPDDVIRLEPISWHDPRFRAFRETAGWKPPGRYPMSWQPPEFLMSLTIRQGSIAGQFSRGAA